MTTEEDEDSMNTNMTQNVDNLPAPVWRAEGNLRVERLKDQCDCPACRFCLEKPVCDQSRF